MYSTILARTSANPLLLPPRHTSLGQDHRRRSQRSPGSHAADRSSRLCGNAKRAYRGLNCSQELGEKARARLRHRSTITARGAGKCGTRLCPLKTCFRWSQHTRRCLGRECSFARSKCVARSRRNELAAAAGATSGTRCDARVARAKRRERRAVLAPQKVLVVKTVDGPLAVGGRTPMTGVVIIGGSGHVGPDRAAVSVPPVSRWLPSVVPASPSAHQRGGNRAHRSLGPAKLRRSRSRPVGPWLAAPMIRPVLTIEDGQHLAAVGGHGGAQVRCDGRIGGERTDQRSSSGGCRRIASRPVEIRNAASALQSASRMVSSVQDPRKREHGVPSPLKSCQDPPGRCDAGKMMPAIHSAAAIAGATERTCGRWLSS